jgi:hypothetical protein
VIARGVLGWAMPIARLALAALLALSACASSGMKSTVRTLYRRDFPCQDSKVKIKRLKDVDSDGKTARVYRARGCGGDASYLCARGTCSRIAELAPTP